MKTLVDSTCWVVTWKSPKQRERKESSFGDFARADDFFEEKLAEGKKPQMHAQRKIVTLERIA
jgi:hypothetical protein